MGDVELAESSTDEGSGLVGRAHAALARDGGIALFLRVAAAAAAYSLIFVSARALSADEYGLFALLLSITQFLGVCAGAGAPTALLRFAPQYLATGRPDLARGVIGYAVLRVGMVGAALFAVSTAVVVVAWWGGHVSNGITLATGMALIPLIAFSNLASAAGRSIGMITVALAPKDVVWRIGGALFVLCGLGAITETWRLQALVGFMIASLAAAACHAGGLVGGARAGGGESGSPFRRQSVMGEDYAAHMDRERRPCGFSNARYGAHWYID